jgi:hypothetical protein
MKRALVIGCAKGVWEEVDQAYAMLRQIDPGATFNVYCVKLAGVHWKGGYFSWITLHPEFMDKYEKQRADLGYHKSYEIVGPLANQVGMHGKEGNISRRVSYRYPGMTGSASSGGFGIKVALDDGNNRVVVAGIPMTMEAGHFTRGDTWTTEKGMISSRDSFIPGFEHSLKYFLGKVKSFSGWTKEKLGEPTPDWLRGDPLPVNLAKVQE